MCHTSQIKLEATESQIKSPAKIIFHFNLFFLIPDFYLCALFCFCRLSVTKRCRCQFYKLFLKACTKTIFVSISFTLVLIHFAHFLVILCGLLKQLSFIMLCYLILFNFGNDMLQYISRQISWLNPYLCLYLEQKMIVTTTLDVQKCSVQLLFEQ